MAASEAAKEAVHIAAFGAELGIMDSEPIDLFVDNKAAIDLAYNPEHHQKTKHIQRRRELVEAKRINVPFVNSVDNLADFFTKPLDARVFYPMRDRIMNVKHSSDHDESVSLP